MRAYIITMLTAEYVIYIYIYILLYAAEQCVFGHKSSIHTHARAQTKTHTHRHIIYVIIIYTCVSMIIYT